MRFKAHQTLLLFTLLLAFGPAAACGGSSGNSGAVPPPPPPPPPPPAETVPAKRAHHAIVYDEANARILITGGSSPFTGGQCCAFFNDLWAFDGTRWTALPSSGASMSGMRLAYDAQNRRVLSFGGFMNGGQIMPDLRVLHNNIWTALTPLTQMPAAESGFIYDSRRGRFVAFGGGSTNDRVNGDTWEFDGNAWTRVATGGPPARLGHVMVYDEQRGRIVVFGGISSVTQGVTPQVFRDLWEFDGSSWREITAPNGPSARSEAGAAYDTNRRVVIIYGGADATSSLGDLWSWNGTVWAKLGDPSPEGPEPRGMGYIAYDKRRDRVVLFGGRIAWPNDANDTWEWDGSRWTRVP
jgi:hypothetical protein